MKLRRLRIILKFLRSITALDLLAVGGFVAIVYGSWQAYTPAGPLVGGGLALAFALAARGGSKQENED